MAMAVSQGETNGRDKTAESHDRDTPDDSSQTDFVSRDLECCCWYLIHHMHGVLLYVCCHVAMGWYYGVVWCGWVV